MIQASPIQTEAVMEVLHERLRQDQKWGEQNHPDGSPEPASVVDTFRSTANWHAHTGQLTWRDVLQEEVYEAYGEIGKDQRLREELIQVAAVAVAWVEAIDRRQS